MQSALSLDDLSEDEQARIWKVLQRDESLRRKNNVKVSKLKGELYGLRMKGILRDGDDLSRLCVRCHCELGLFFNKGEICPSCRFKICKTCRVALISGGWTCIYCFKQMQLKWLSGEWIRPQVQRQSINRRLSGSDIVRSAFVSGNAGKAVTEEIRRAITNGSAPPSSEDLERTSSFESSPIGASTLHDADVERVGFPSESDSFRLSRLIGSYTNKSTSSEEKERVCIKRATSRPYRDSDSDSSSSTATSPVLSKARQSLARSTPSLNTATTPEHGSKKDLRSNKKTADNHRSNSPGADFVLGRQVSSSSGQSISPSEPTENCQNGRRTSTRSGNLSNASSKTRLLDLAVYSSKKNLSASTDSGQAPLSLQADTGSETELFNHSQSSGSRTKLSSDASDNETPIDSYFMDHLSKEEELKQSKLTGDSKKKVSSPKSNKDALTDVNESHTYSGGGGGSGSGGGRDDISDSSSLHTTPEHWLNGNKRKVDLDASLPSITISEAEGSVSARDESEEENNDYLKGSQQSFRSGQSMTSSLGFTSSMGSRDSLSSYYSNAGEVNYGKINVTGDIQFGLDYDYKTVCLEIRIKQCRDLAPADIKKNRSDPYVKSYLLPDKSKTGKRKTKVKKNTLSPVFDEILRYSIAKSELENRTLWLTVWHNDRFGRNDFLGEVTIPFDYYRFEGPTLKWYSLQQRQEFTPSSLAYKGELSISLKYVSVGDVLTGSTTSLKQSHGGGRSPESGTGGQLHVFIKEARNLTAVRSGGYSDPFCKGYLLPEKNRSSKQKTPVVKKNCNPVWNHLFIFEDVSANELSDRCLELTLWDYDRLSSNDFLGGIRLNLGSGIFGRKYVDWMDASGAEVSLWQSMMSSPNTWVDGTLILRANMNNRK